MGQQAFDAAVRDIVRCWDAWQQLPEIPYSSSPSLEVKALDIIAKKPLHQLGTVIVDRGEGKLEMVHLDPDEEDDPAEGPSCPVPFAQLNPSARKPLIMATLLDCCTRALDEISSINVPVSSSKPRRCG